MRKMLSAALLMCIVALLSTLSTAVHATLPTTASGDWTYTPSIIEQHWADGNQFIYGKEVSTWIGTFQGTSDDVFTVIKHEKIWNVKGLIDFTGTVDGKSGTLAILFVGKLTPPTRGMVRSMGDPQRHGRSGESPWAGNLVGTTKKCRLFGADTLRA